MPRFTAQPTWATAAALLSVLAVLSFSLMGVATAEECRPAAQLTRGYYRLQLDDGVGDRWMSVLGIATNTSVPSFTSRSDGTFADRTLRIINIPEVDGVVIEFHGNRYLHVYRDRVLVQKEAHKRELTFRSVWRVVGMRGDACPTKVRLLSLGATGFLAVKGHRMIIVKERSKASVFNLYEDTRPSCQAEMRDRVNGRTSKLRNNNFVKKKAFGRPLDQYLAEFQSCSAVSNLVPAEYYVLLRGGPRLKTIAAKRLTFSDSVTECWNEQVYSPPPITTRVRPQRPPITLFGTFKPLKQIAPLDANSPYDGFIIARRTLMNWASLQGVQPIAFVDDENNQIFINQLNEQRNTGMKNLTIISSFEIHPTFSQPTYRGMFKAALERYPDADLIMFSNTDILYTSSLIETIRAVQDYYENVILPANPDMRGIAIYGQRTTVVTPPHWPTEEDMMNAAHPNAAWDRVLENQLQPKGMKDHDVAQDYFIISRSLFDWNAVPDFVVGGVRFDNYMIENAVRMGKERTAFVVDATDSLLAIHQKHSAKEKTSHWKPKSFYNIQLYEQVGGLSPARGRVRYCPFFTLLSRRDPRREEANTKQWIFIASRDYLLSLPSSKRT